MDTPVLCPFRLCTGYACPGCGLTRSALAVVRGDLETAWRYHPFVFVLVVELAVVAAVLWYSGSGWLRRHIVPIVSLNGAALLSLWVTRWHLGLLDVVLT